MRCSFSPVDTRCGRMFAAQIGGEWLDAQSGKTFETIDPSVSDHLPSSRVSSDIVNNLDNAA